MNVQCILAICLVSFISTAVAQESNTFHGTYGVSWINESTQVMRSAELIINDTGGSWRETTSRISSNNPCIGNMKVPISVTSPSSKVMIVRAKYAETLQGCQDLTIRLNLTDTNTITGTMGKISLTLKKK